MTNTIDIKGPDGSTVDIEVAELSNLEQIVWAGKAPEQLQEEGNEIRLTEDLANFMIELVENQTVLTRELMDELEQEELMRLFTGTMSYAFGREEADLERDDTVEFNNDGSLDLDDWR